MTTEHHEHVRPEGDERRNEGLLETAMSVLSEPVPTLRGLTRDPRIWWAIVVTIAVSLGSGLVTAAQAGTVASPPALGGPPEAARMMQAVGVALAVLSPLFAIVGLAIGTGVLQLSSYLLGGRGSYAGLFTAMGLAQVPYVFGIPAQLLPVALGTLGSVIATLIGVGLAIWVLVLGVVSVRENHDFTTGRAVTAVLIPLGALILVGVVVVILVAVLVASSAGGGF
jgi:hypothetical protein